MWVVGEPPPPRMAAAAEQSNVGRGQRRPKLKIHATKIMNALRLNADDAHRLVDGLYLAPGEDMSDAFARFPNSPAATAATAAADDGGGFAETPRPTTALLGGGSCSTLPRPPPVGGMDIGAVRISRLGQDVEVLVRQRARTEALARQERARRAGQNAGQNARAVLLPHRQQKQDRLAAGPHAASYTLTRQAAGEAVIRSMLQGAEEAGRRFLAGVGGVPTERAAGIAVEQLLELARHAVPDIELLVLEHSDSQVGGVMGLAAGAAGVSGTGMHSPRGRSPAVSDWVRRAETNGAPRMPIQMCPGVVNRVVRTSAATAADRGGGGSHGNSSAATNAVALLEAVFARVEAVLRTRRAAARRTATRQQAGSRSDRVQTERSSLPSPPVVAGWRGVVSARRAREASHPAAGHPGVATPPRLQPSPLSKHHRTPLQPRWDERSPSPTSTINWQSSAGESDPALRMPLPWCAAGTSLSCNQVPLHMTAQSPNFNSCRVSGTFRPRHALRQAVRRSAGQRRRKPAVSAQLANRSTHAIGLLVDIAAVADKPAATCRSFESGPASSRLRCQRLERFFVHGSASQQPLRCAGDRTVYCPDPAWDGGPPIFYHSLAPLA